MADTTFVDKKTVVEATWLNDVNDVVYTDLGGVGGIGSSAGASRVGYLPSGTGALPTTVQAELQLHQVNIKNYALGNGTDETVAVQNFINACAGKKGIISAGIYVVSSLTIPANTILEGEGSGVSIIKRKNAALDNNSVVTISGVTGVTLRGIGFDGNKANQTLGTNTITIATSDNIRINECEFINAKAASGFGSGISVLNGTGQSNVRKINISHNRFSGNDGVDLFINKTYYMEVSSNIMKNSGGGISVLNFVFPPVADVQDYILIADNVIRDQTGTGITFSGYVDSGSSQANLKTGPNTPPNRHCVIRGNIVASCTQYGIVWQGTSGTIVGNSISKCGAVSGGGGILMNAAASVFEGNTVFDCYHYGIDAGGSYACSIVGNSFYWNGVTANSAATDINCGGAQNVLVSSNVIEQAGTHQMFAINAKGIEGDGVAPFSLPGGFANGLTIASNRIQLNSNALSLGIWVNDSQERVVVTGNNVRNAQPNRAYIFEAFGIVSSGNMDESSYALSGNSVIPVASAATLIIPDTGNVFSVTGTTNITNLLTFSANTFNGKIRSCQATSHGSGYSRSTPPTVTFSGGGGAGLAATALVTYNGELAGWQITNNGSGYTSAPTPSITHNGGSGGNCVPQLGCDNSEGREITLFFNGALTVTNGGNLALNGNYVTTGNISCLRLISFFGNWYEMSRR